MTKTKITMPFSSWLLLLLLLRNPTGSLGAADITTMCQESAYTDGARSEVVCYINTTAVASATCFDTPTVVLIELRTPDGVPTVLCRTAYPGTCVNPNVSCGCAENFNNTAKYQVQFTANEITQKGSSISCSIGCEPPLSTNTTVGCQSMKFSSFDLSTNSSFPPGENSTLASPDDKNATLASPDDKDETFCTKSCIIGLAVGIICGIAAVVGVITLGVLCKMGKISGPQRTNKGSRNGLT